jgi:tight adherence protein B
MRFKATEGFFSPFTTALASRGHDTGLSATVECVLALALLMTLIASLLTSSVVTGLLLVASLLALVRFRACSLGDLRKARLLEQLPDAIKGLAICYGAGLTLYQSVEQTAKGMSRPIRDELEAIASDITAGRGINEALDSFKERTGLPSVDYLGAVLEIHQRTGGSLEGLLFGAADAITSDLELDRHMKVQTAQSRMSYKVVTMMPILIMLVMTLANPEYLASFFTTSAGFLMFSMACVLEVAGIFMIRKTLRMDSDQP